MTLSKRIRILLIFFQSSENSTLSYQHGWPRAFLETNFFECTPVNLARLGLMDQFAVASRLHTGRFEAVVLLHSVFSNQRNLSGLFFRAIAACKLPKAYFIGNEYKLMPEKIWFCKFLRISLLITQSNDHRVASMYRAALGCSVSCIPNTGIDTKFFMPKVALNDRQVDIGYRSYPATWYLGNNEKTEIAQHFTNNADRYRLITDISLSPQDRFDVSGYALFLNRCRGQIGTEAGGDYFELNDDTRNRVNVYMTTNPDCQWPEIKRLFFDNYNSSVPIRIISGRQVEAAACKTIQILFEGRYSGYLLPDVHYIPLTKNFSNAEEVIEKFKDLKFCSMLVENAYELVMSKLTYNCLLASFAVSLRQVL